MSLVGHREACPAFAGVSEQGVRKTKAAPRKGAPGSCVQTVLMMEDGADGSEAGTGVRSMGSDGPSVQQPQGSSSG